MHETLLVLKPAAEVLERLWWCLQKHINIAAVTTNDCRARKGSSGFPDHTAARRRGAERCRGKVVMHLIPDFSMEIWVPLAAGLVLLYLFEEVLQDSDNSRFQGHESQPHADAVTGSSSKWKVCVRLYAVLVLLLEPGSTTVHKSRLIKHENHKTEVLKALTLPVVYSKGLWSGHCNPAVVTWLWKLDEDPSCFPYPKGSLSLAEMRLYEGCWQENLSLNLSITFMVVISSHSEKHIGNETDEGTVSFCLNSHLILVICTLRKSRRKCFPLLQWLFLLPISALLSFFFFLPSPPLLPSPSSYSSSFSSSSTFSLNLCVPFLLSPPPPPHIHREV